MEFQANEGKKLTIMIDGVEYLRIPVKTHVVMREDDLGEVVDKYTKDIRQEGDIIFCSEKIVAITQGRSFHINDIHPSWLAKFLVKFVYKSPYGIGLGSPYTMQLAIEELMDYEIDTLNIPSDVQISEQLLEFEKERVKMKTNKRKVDTARGEAFHEKKDKNKKVNLGGPGKRSPKKSAPRNRAVERKRNEKRKRK